jgi:hypothetical protein
VSAGLRSVLYPLRLVAARLGRRSAPVVLVVLGLAAGAAVLLGGRAGSVVAQDRAVAQSVERIPDGSRSVRAVWFGLPLQGDEPEPALDRRARAALEHTGAGAATALVLYRESTFAGVFAALGGVEGLGGHVRLRSGRLPRRCEPERCEVLQLRGTGRLPQPEGLRLVKVGEAVLESRILFGDFLPPTDNALEQAEVSPAFARAAGYHRPPPPPLFLAEGVETLAGVPALASSYRSYAWVAPLREGNPRLWEVDELAAGVAQARSELQSVSTNFDVIAPVEELREAQATSEAAGRRLGILGGEAAALLFAFALLAAMTLRTDLAASRRRLAWYGARGWQLALLTVGESAVLALVGTVLGLGVAAVAGAFTAQRAGAPVGAVIARSVLSPEGLGLALLVAAGATAVLVATVAAKPPAGSRFTLLDAAAVAAIALVVLELAWGDGEGDLVLLTPALVTLAAAVLVARILRPALRLVERLARGRSLGLRLASLTLARNPGYAVVATAFLVVSFGLALFAESYRATLARGERDQAAQRVPLDYLLREDLRRLIPVQDAAPLSRFAFAGVAADPVLRLSGGVGRLEGETGVTLLGLPPRAIPQLHGWRESDADAGRDELARRIDFAPAVAGLRLPPDEGRLGSAVRSRLVRVFAEIEGPRGRFTRAELGTQLPAEARGGRLVGIALEPATRLIERGADAGKAVSGSVELPLAPELLEGWVGVGGAELVGRTVRFTLTNTAATRIRPRQPSDTVLVPVLATPRLAAAADEEGRLPLQIAGERITVRVAGVVRRFPGVEGQAVVGDVDALTTLVNVARPGAARVNEVWLRLLDDSARQAVDARLARGPFDVLTVESRRALEADARRDPIAHGTLLALAIAAAVALGLALAGILLTVLGDLRDERGELFDLEAQGAAPALLRRVVRLRALTVAGAGLVAGALAGLALAAVVTDLVGLTARATTPDPPLVLDVDARVVAAAVLLYALGAVALVVGATSRAFSAPVPGRAEVRD